MRSDCRSPFFAGLPTVSVVPLFGVLLSGGAAYSQDKPAQIEVSTPRASLIAQERVTEVVSFLASDAMGGRNTPSRGLERAADYIAAAFEKAGLKPAGKSKDYFHRYELPGVEIDTDAVKVVLHMDGGEEGVVLKPGQDVRVYVTGSAEFAREDTDVIVVEEAGAAQRLRGFPREPVIILVDPETSALWKTLEGNRQMLTGRRGLRSRTPQLLVRKDAMPKGELDHAEITVAAAKKLSVPLRNVVGVLPGRGENKGEFVMFSAHYDHVGMGLPRNGDGIFNGADDDATGTTAVVTLAEAFAKAARGDGRSLMFTCFSGEEKGLLGSKAFAESPPVPLSSIAVNLNLEMLGRPDQIRPKAAWVTGRQYSDFEAIVKIGFARAGIECVEFARATALFNASDNASLARKGVVAHSISAGSLHQDYHRPSDHVEKLDLPHMTAVIRGIFEAGLEFATRGARPAYNPEGRRHLRLDR